MGCNFGLATDRIQILGEGRVQMRKQTWKAAATAVFCSLSVMTAFAGTWRIDGGNRWYQNDDGTYPKNGWAWIDGDGDGVSECYYFDENGYALIDTVTPDGCQVNGMGAWVQDGEVQTRIESGIGAYGPGGSGNTGSTGSGSTGSGYGPGGAGDSGTGGSNSDGSDDFYSWLWGYEYDPNWYLYDETLSEGDKAYYHYQANYYNWEGKSMDTYQKVEEQFSRIAENPLAETTAQEMVWVEIPVWRLVNGQKVADTDRVQVLSSIADEVKAIFTEIYNGPEQFPINSIGGYSWRSNGLNSYHSSGLAIDINPDQNPQVREDGTVLVGSKWEPGVNPYSISQDSDVVKAFGKYGWNWGAAFTTKDYMHFEY